MRCEGLLQGRDKGDRGGGGGWWGWGRGEWRGGLLQVVARRGGAGATGSRGRAVGRASLRLGAYVSQEAASARRCVGVIVYSMCHGSAWHAYSMCQGSAWHAYSMCQGSAWHAYSMCHGSAWHAYSMCQGSAWHALEASAKLCCTPRPVVRVWVRVRVRVRVRAIGLGIVLELAL